MIKKIVLISVASILLGGCGLIPLKNNAASDQKLEQVAPASPSPSSDPAIETMPSPGTQNDTTTLETDIESTTILEEDFSDLE
jgi:hypothetical protein